MQALTSSHGARCPSHAGRPGPGRPPARTACIVRPAWSARWAWVTRIPGPAHISRWTQGNSFVAGLGEREKLVVRHAQPSCLRLNIMGLTTSICAHAGHLDILISHRTGDFDGSMTVVGAIPKGFSPQAVSSWLPMSWPSFDALWWKLTTRVST